MGEYCELRIGQLTLESWKNDIEPSAMMLFVENDKRVVAISKEQWESEGGDLEYWSIDRCRVFYTCTVREMKDRLDLRGFTWAVSDKAFAIGAHYRIRDLRNSLAISADVVAKYPVANPAPSYIAEKDAERHSITVLEEMTASSWLEAFRKACLDDRCGHYVTLDQVRDLDLPTQYVLTSAVSWFGFPALDFRCMFRVALEAFPDDEEVIYDLTDLVDGGYFEADAEMVRYAEYRISREYEVNRTTIVLTEGSTDRWIVERSMKLLFPHLAPFFSFMDFDGVRVEGGAGALANTVRAFSGARVSNRVIAIFDNDTAGRTALSSLRAIALPRNIKAFTLPEIEIARSYPTLGPSGVSVMDINGMACGIELYLGADVLREPGGALTPIQWKGFDVKLRQYQGELLAKGEVLDRFKQKLGTCESDLSRLSEYGWNELKLVIDVLRTAFHEEDASAHLDFEFRPDFEDSSGDEGPIPEDHPRVTAQCRAKSPTPGWSAILPLRSADGNFRMPCNPGAIRIHSTRIGKHWATTPAQLRVIASESPTRPELLVGGRSRVLGNDAYRV